VEKTLKEHGDNLVDLNEWRKEEFTFKMNNFDHFLLKFEENFRQMNSRVIHVESYKAEKTIVEALDEFSRS